MSETLHCTNCDRELLTKMDEFGDVGFELCQWCYLAQIDEYEYDIEKPVECIACHKTTAYDKTPIGYPGMFHCAGCGVWWDVVDKLAWRIVLADKSDAAATPRDEKRG